MSFPFVFSLLWNALLNAYYWLLSLPTFLATLLGVLTAFLLNSFAVRWTNHNTRNRLRRDLRIELRNCVTRLREYQVKRIATDTLYLWQLAVHSGDARFLRSNERKEIAGYYFALDNYNYEAELVRKFGEDWRQSIGLKSELPKKKLWDERSKQIRRTQEDLADRVEEFVNRVDFWPRDC